MLLLSVPLAKAESCDGLEKRLGKAITCKKIIIHIYKSVWIIRNENPKVAFHQTKRQSVTNNCCLTTLDRFLQ